MSISAGVRLKQARESLNLKIEDIAHRTRIQKKYLLAIENGQYDMLPSSIYLRSYVKSYAGIVGENSQFLIESIITELNRPKSTSNRAVNRKNRTIMSPTPTLPRHRVLLEGNDPSHQVQVSPFVSRRAKGITESEQASFVDEREKANGLYSSNQEIAVAKEQISFSRKVALPVNLPNPQELGIQTKPEQPKADLSVLSRRNTHKNESSKEKKDYGRIYTWVLIVAAVLLTMVVLASIFLTNKPLAQNNEQTNNATSSTHTAIIHDKSKKPILRELQAGIDYDRYELANADTLDLSIRGEKGKSLFEIRDKEVNLPFHKGEVTTEKNYHATYKKTIWLTLNHPNQVEVLVNGYPVKTKSYSKEKKYVITLLQ